MKRSFRKFRTFRKSWNFRRREQILRGKRFFGIMFTMVNPTTIKLEYRNGRPSVLRKATVFTELNFYKRSEILYQLTVVFCRRFLPKYGDRTVDQMTQAARSTKQNIIEGYSDGQTSFETEIKLLGVARGSNQELLADYQDYRGFGHSCGSQRPQNMRTIPIVVAPACGNTIAHLFPLGRAGDNRNGPRCSERRAWGTAVSS